MDANSDTITTNIWISCTSNIFFGQAAAYETQHLIGEKMVTLQCCQIFCVVIQGIMSNWLVGVDDPWVPSSIMFLCLGPKCLWSLQAK